MTDVAGQLERKLRNLAPGDHLCCIYRTDAEHRTIVTPFVAQGLAAGQKVVYIADARTARDILGYLDASGLGTRWYLEAGQLHVLTAAEVYTREGSFDPDRMIGFLKGEAERALTEGYSALRVTGEMSWALRGLPGSERLIEYEAKLNDFLPGSKCLAICQYDQRAFPPGVLLSVLTTHPIAIIGTDILDNFYYISPKDLLGPDPEGARLSNWLRSLTSMSEGREALRSAHEGVERQVQERTKGLVEANEQLRLQLTQRAQAQEESREHLRFEQLVAELSARFAHAEAESVETAIRTALGELMEFFAVDRCGLLQYSPDEHKLHLSRVVSRAGVTRQPEVVDVGRMFPWINGRLLSGYAVCLASRDDIPAGATVDAASHPVLAVRSLLLVPITVGGSVTHAMAVSTAREERQWPAYFAPRLRLIGEMFATALARNEARASQREQSQFEDLLFRLSSRLIDTPAPGVDAAVQGGIRELVDFCGVDRGWLFELEADERLRTVYAWAADGVERASQVSPREELPWAWRLLQKGLACAVSSLEELPDEATADRASMARAGLRSVLVVPIRTDGTLRYVFALAAVLYERSWPVGLVARIRLAAEMLVSALERKRAGTQPQ